MRRILVAGSYIPTRQALAMILQRAGWEVDCVLTGHDALAALARRTYDVLLVDVDITPGDGWHLLTTLQKAPYHPPVVALAGTESAGGKQAHALGVKVVLPKPVSRSTLLAGVRAALEHPWGQTRRCLC
jgi:DNA-binding response OmpR family regulator